MTTKIAKTAAAALVAAMTAGAGLIAAAPTPAEASEHCKGVYINVANPSGATVKVIDIDAQGRVRLSRRVLLTEEETDEDGPRGGRGYRSSCSTTRVSLTGTRRRGSPGCWRGLPTG